MPHKTFEDETFTLKNLNIKVNDLTSSDPHVDQVILTPEEDSVDTISYSANKKVEKSATKKDPVSGIEFDASAEETEDKKLSELPEKLKKLNAVIQDGRTPTIHTNVGRYTSDDGENTSFYLTDDHIENMDVSMEDDEETEESEDQEEESDDSEESVF